MIRYYCSAFNTNNAFGHGLGDMFKAELKNTKSIVYIPGNPDKIEKIKKKLFQYLLSDLKKLELNLKKLI